MPGYDDNPEPGGWWKVAIDHLDAAARAMGHIEHTHPDGHTYTLEDMGGRYLQSLTVLAVADWRAHWRELLGSGGVLVIPIADDAEAAEVAMALGQRLATGQPITLPDDAVLRFTPPAGV